MTRRTLLRALSGLAILPFMKFKNEPATPGKIKPEDRDLDVWEQPPVICTSDPFSFICQTCRERSVALYQSETGGQWICWKCDNSGIYWKNE